MHIRHLSALLFAAVISISAPAFAQNNGSSPTQVTVDLTKLDSTARDAVIESLKKKDEKAPVVTADTAKQWADVGKNIGDAIAATASALSVGVNDFIKTPAGLLTIGMLIMYLFGHAFWAIIGGSIVWIALGLVIWKSFRIFHIPTRVKLADGSVRLETYTFGNDQAKVISAIAHAGAFVLLSITMLAIIF